MKICRMTSLQQAYEKPKNTKKEAAAPTRTDAVLLSADGKKVLEKLKDDPQYQQGMFEIREKLVPLEHRFFNPRIEVRDEAIGSFHQSYEADAKAMVREFARGRASIEDVTDYFERAVKEAARVYTERGYMADNKAENAQLLTSMYDNFRRFVNTAIAQVNYEEGAQYCEFERANSYVYYNAEYYYRAKDLMQALVEKTNAVGRDMGVEDYEANTEFGGIYRNFNTASFMGTLSSMLDLDEEPARDFRFFYQENPPAMTIRRAVIEDGVMRWLDEEPKYVVGKELKSAGEIKAPGSYSAIVKAWGAGWYGETTVPFEGNLNDFHNAAGLFGGKDVPKGIYDTLRNFRVFSQGASRMHFYADKYGWNVDSDFGAAGKKITKNGISKYLKH